MKRSQAVWLLVPILLILWGVAVWGANADAIWVDEWWTTYYSGTAPNSELTSIEGVINRVAENRVHENNPVGYYVLMHLWQGVVGRSDVAMRLLSALCSLITVALIYRLGRAIGGLRVGIAAAVILAFSAFFVNYSHELRMYAMAIMWGALGLLAYWKFMHLPKASPVWGATLLLSAACLLYTHYGNTMLVVLLGACHLFVRPKNRRWWQALGLAIGAGVLFLPHLPLTLGIGNRFTEKLTTTDIMASGSWPVPDVIRMTIMGFANEQILFVAIILVAALVALRSFFGSDVSKAKRDLPSQRVREGLILSGALSLGGILTLVALRLTFQTVFHVRYLLVVWLPLSLFAALVITQSLRMLPRQWQNWAASGLAAVWIIAGIALSLDIHFHGNYIHPIFRPAFTELERWDDIGDLLRHEAAPVDAVAVSVGEELAWAHRGDAEYYVSRSPARLLMLEGDNVNPDDFEDFVHGAGRVWLARSLEREPSPQYVKMEAAIQAQGYQVCGDPRVQGNVSLSLYSVVPQCCARPDTSLGSYGGFADLRYHQAVVGDDGMLHIWQGWDISPDTPKDTYSIGWYVFDGSKNVIAQLDRSLMTPGYSCILAEIPVSAEAASVRTGVYSWADGVRLPLVTTNENADNLLALPLEK